MTIGNGTHVGLDRLGPRHQAGAHTLGRRRAPTLWEEGTRPGRQVVLLAAVAALAVVGADLALSNEITILFDLAFVTICVTAALSVRPRDLFVVGVLPPLMMLGTVLILALTARGAIAEPVDGVIQAVVSGLAHHAGALIVGYGLTLGIVAMRQLVTRRELPVQSVPQQRRHSAR